MSDTTEPAPLTDREMKQFVTLAALPTLERALERLRWLEAQRAGLTNPTTIMVRIDEGWITPSDAVREITRLRAEVAALKAKTRRKVVQLIVLPKKDHYWNELYALADDGTIWQRYEPKGWSQTLDIPQSEQEAKP